MKPRDVAPRSNPHRLRWQALATGFAALLLASGCSSTASTGSLAGELGNGAFYFSCDDAVAFTPYSNDAAKFPKFVSLGSTFQVRFVSKSASSSNIKFNEGAPDRGIVVSPIGAEFVSRGPSGLVALKLGLATLASRDASGQLVDYAFIRIAKPDALVVYSADDRTEKPTRIDSLLLEPGERTNLRAFAQAKKEVLAGSLQIEWRSQDTKTVDIESTTEGVATVIAKAPGKTQIIATGGTFPQSIEVEVKP